MKLNRNSKKWVELYNQRLAEILKEKPYSRYQFESTGESERKESKKIPVYGWITESTGAFFPKKVFKITHYRIEYEYKPIYKKVDYDLMPDRIKEAEEYADRLFSAMR